MIGDLAMFMIQSKSHTLLPAPILQLLLLMQMYPGFLFKVPIVGNWRDSR